MLLDVLVFRGLHLVEALVVVDAPAVGGGMVVEAVIAAADLDAGHVDHRQLTFDLYGAPAVGDQLGLERGEGHQTLAGGLALEDQSRLMFLSEGRLEMLVEAFGEFLGDGLGVLAVPHRLIPAEAFQRRVQEGAEAGTVQFQVIVRGLPHPEGVLEPEVRRVGEVVPEAGRRKARPDRLGLAGSGGRGELQVLGNLPVGLLLGGDVFLEEMADAAGEFFVGTLEEQARGAESVAVRIEARYDDVEAALAAIARDGLAGAAQFLEGVGGVGEVAFRGG